MSCFQAASSGNKLNHLLCLHKYPDKIFLCQCPERNFCIHCIPPARSTLDFHMQQVVAKKLAT